MGEKYRPANGMEGAIFIQRWCDRCERDAAYRAGTGDSCPIAAGVMALDASDPEYPGQWTVSDNGTPICTAFQSEEVTVRPYLKRRGEG
jgi:hypothetical protein